MGFVKIMNKDEISRFMTSKAKLELKLNECNRLYENAETEIQNAIDTLIKLNPYIFEMTEDGNTETPEYLEVAKMWGFLNDLRALWDAELASIKKNWRG
jgi:hypothetical protein